MENQEIQNSILPVFGESISADSGVDAIADKLLTVKLDPTEYADFNAIYYPRTKMYKTSKVSRLDYKTVAFFISSNSLAINRTFNFLRGLLSKGDYLDVMQGEALQYEYIHKVANNVLELSEDAKEFVAKETSTSVKKFLGNICSGTHHIIQESKGKDGGFDIVYCGVPDADSLVNLSYGTEHFVLDLPESSEYTSAAYSKYKTPLSLKILEVLTKINAHLGLSSDKKGAHKRQFIDVSLRNDFFKEIDNILIEANLLPTNNGFFTGIIPLQPNVLEGVSKILKITMVVEPYKIVTKAFHDFNRKEAIAEANPDIEKPAPLDPSKLVSDEAFLASPNINMTFSVHIPENIARYVTQTPEDKEVSLFLLHTWARTWSFYHLKMSRTKGEGRSSLPRYVMPPSSIEKITELRKEFGYHIEEGKVDDNGMFITDRGSMAYAPKAKDISFDATKAYEKDMDALVRATFELGSPLDMNSVRATSSEVFTNGDPDALVKISALKELKDTIREYSGEVIAQNWDYSTIISLTDNGSKMTPTSLVNVNVPDDLAIADYLGYSFDEGLDTPITKRFNESLSLLIKGTTKGDNTLVDKRDIGSTDVPNAFVDLPFFSNLLSCYNSFVVKGTAPTFQDLVKQAAKNLKYTSENFRDNPYEKDLYLSQVNGEVIDSSMNVAYNAGTLDSEAVRSVLKAALYDAAGGIGTNLRSVTMESVGGGASNDELFNAMADDNHFFTPDQSRMFDFNNVYNYLGGQIFYLVCKFLADMPAKEFLAVDIPLNKKLEADGQRRVGFEKKSQEVKPVAVMLAKYVPNYEKIFERADSLTERNAPEAGMGAEDVSVPGINKGSQVFPHQVVALSGLAKQPKFAILDVDPGGGKTITILIDVMKIISESSDRIRPLLIAPDGLCKNWTNDLNKIVGDSWNVIPITNKVLSSKEGEWTFDAIDKLFSAMPKNTIVVAGINFLKSKMFPIVIGNHVQQTSAPLELIKRHGFNYIALDESHKAKNPGTAVYKVIKQITSATHVKYIRLATGTLISNNLKDVVGQTALYSAHVFRTVSEFEDENTFVAENGKTRQFYPTTPITLRKKLARHASVITIKRKEWAFMLPTPVETFEAVGLEGEDTEHSDLHAQIYNAVLEKELAVLQDAVTKARNKGGTDSEEDDGDEGTESLGNMELGEGESELAGLQTVLKPFIARLERILTDPMGDVDSEGNAFGATVFAKAGVTNFVTRKVKAVIRKIDSHFNTPKWDRGEEYEELTTIEHKGKNYLLRKTSEGSTRIKRPDVGEPGVDTEAWKVEPKGKCLVFCRYTRSVEAIYNALPPEYKSIARKFSGEEGEAKWKNLEDFKTDDGVQIIIANEQAITEGHNLQMASRLIRVEAPWAPGDLEQAQARIFRPDPDAAKSFAKTGKPGELYREVIYLDWIIANGSLEVQKMGRLISKMIDKTKFDENGNSLYRELDDISLPPINMSMEMLEDKWDISRLSGEMDIDTETGIMPEQDPSMMYIPVYNMMQRIRAGEFTSMRKVKNMAMMALPETSMFEGAAKLDNVPLLPDQEISDPEKFGLVGGTSFMSDKKNADYKNSPELLKGLPVHTSLGNGVIVSVNKTKAVGIDEHGQPIKNMLNPISSVRVKLKEEDRSISLKMSMVYIATDVSEERMGEFVKPASRKRNSQIPAIEEDAIADKAAVSKRRRNAKALKGETDAMVEGRKRGKKRKDNLANGRPVNKGVNSARSDVIEPPEPIENAIEVPVPDKKIELNIGVYNGFLSLFAEVDDPDVPNLDKLNFKSFGPYAYIKIKTKNQLHALYDYLEDDEDNDKGWELTDSNYVKPMNEIVQSFEKGNIGRSRFSPALAPLNTLKNFFLRRHKLLKDRDVLRVYPVVLEDSLMVCIDLRTNPIFRNHKNDTVPGIGKNAKWRISPGMMVYFSKEKTPIKKKLKDLQKVGYTITNIKKVEKAYTKLKPRKAQINKGQ